MDWVFIPGLLCNERVFQHQMEALKPEGAIFVAEPLQNSGDKMVEALLRSAPPKFALAGHSMGGWLALEVVKKAPQRVLRLCLMNTSARSDSTEKAERRRVLMTRVQQGEFQPVAKELSKAFVLNPDLEQEVESMFLEVGSRAFINQEIAMLNRASSLPILPQVVCPTLVIHAQEDRNFTLEEHQELAGRIPFAKLAVVEKSGHMSPMEQPEEVTRLLQQWLRD